MCSGRTDWEMFVQIFEFSLFAWDIAVQKQSLCLSFFGWSFTFQVICLSCKEEIQKSEVKILRTGMWQGVCPLSEGILFMVRLMRWKVWQSTSRLARHCVFSIFSLPPSVGSVVQVPFSASHHPFFACFLSFPQVPSLRCRNQLVTNVFMEGIFYCNVEKPKLNSNILPTCNMKKSSLICIFGSIWGVGNSDQPKLLVGRATWVLSLKLKLHRHTYVDLDLSQPYCYYTCAQSCWTP